ncbi:hypothetical protein AB6D20_028095 (plasmid) [Vibrio splendidus]
MAKIMAMAMALVGLTLGNGSGWADPHYTALYCNRSTEVNALERIS